MIETQGLMTHSSDTQKELSAAINKQEELRLANNKLLDEIDSIKSSHGRVMDRMHEELQRKDDELHRYATAETKLKDEVAHLELIAHENKKHFNQQIVDMNADMKALTDDIGTT